MEGFAYEAAKEAVIAVVKLVADEQTQTRFRQKWAVEEHASSNDRDRPQARSRVLRRMVGCLHDGVSYGNWPSHP